MNKLKITTGKWTDNGLYIVSGYLKCSNMAPGTIICKIPPYWHNKLRWKDNSKLICDAANTYQQCGLLPSELLEALKNTRKYLDHAPNCIWDDESVRTCGWDKIIELFERIEKQENETN